MVMFHGVVIPHFQHWTSLTLCDVEFIYSGMYIYRMCIISLSVSISLALALTEVISFLIQVSKERLQPSSPLWVGVRLFPA